MSLNLKEKIQMKITNPEDFKTFKIGDRFYLHQESKQIWEILEIKPRGLIMGLWHYGQTYSHKTFLEWSYFKNYIKKHGGINKI